MQIRFAEIFQGPLRALREKFDRSRIDSVEALTKFVHTRSAFISQTALHGYLKARMGTQFRQHFEDESFAKSIRIAAIKVFVSCAGDLAVFAVATAGRNGALAPSEAETLSKRCFQEAIRRCLEPEDLQHVPPDAISAFDDRVASTLWANAALGENAFGRSVNDLVLYAPVVDEFKELDQEFVRNSIRFRWRDVREQLRSRLSAPAVCADFRSARQ